jgi:hypothetical protein
VSGKWGVAILFFLLGVIVANRVGFLAPLAGSQSGG